MLKIASEDKSVEVKMVHLKEKGEIRIYYNNVSVISIGDVDGAIYINGLSCSESEELKSAEISCVRGNVLTIFEDGHE